MKAKVGHLFFLIQNYEENIHLFKKLFAYFEWSVLHDEHGFLGVNTGSTSLWFSSPSVEQTNHRDANGLNHIGIDVGSREEVDTFVNDFMKPNNVEALFETPKERPDFMFEGSDYYQVMFEFPGSVLFEVLYSGKKQ